MSTLSLEGLRAAVAGGAVAFRSINRLMPAGGPGDKVFPPTYLKERGATTKYATETRVIDGEKKPSVLLDSVASQANRMEEALLEAWRREELAFPLVRVNFSQVAELEDLDTISALQAPHRIADALLRDSLLDGVPFRVSPVGKAITSARPDHATAMFTYCPTALVFGVWDSTGPLGGSGAKFGRALVSEIVGVGAEPGVKTASRIDPAAIQRAVEIKVDPKDPTSWTSEEIAGKKAKPYDRGGKGDKGRPSAINHGNIPPTIDREGGGVTIEYALHTVVLSLPALRRIRFTTRTDGSAFADRAARDAAELAARTALAALALAAVVHQHEVGYDLRSRSLLVGTGPLAIELLERDGTAHPVEVTRESVNALVAAAAAAAAAAGLTWDAAPVELVPAPKLADIIRASRRLALSGASSDDGEAVD
ncbi:MAG: type I-U CRISPR-associated protein Cas7 [Kofleriaceae bacterium]|nr:type I-U CRISPR-associated protein Cas7 [Kofleriaceae bacterium]MBP9856812.1 type I-U CRISPR-associated protein Cas7 [Kofleriaceae bacterium]